MPAPDTPNINHTNSGSANQYEPNSIESGNANSNALADNQAAHARDVNGPSSRRRRNNRQGDGEVGGESAGAQPPQQSDDKRRRSRQPEAIASPGHEDEGSSLEPRSTSSSAKQQGRGRGGKPRVRAHPNQDQRIDGSSNSLATGATTQSGNRRGRRINTRPHLDTHIQQPNGPDQSASALQHPPGQRKGQRSQGKQANKKDVQASAVSLPLQEDTLTSRLIQSFKTPPYPDCPICFNSIRPMQPVWSCSPDNQPFQNQPFQNAPFDTREQGVAEDDSQGAISTQCCYTPFHLKCIQSWAYKSVKDTKEAYRTRGIEGRRGEWRCPGCQRRRFDVPSAYRCFCHSTVDPQPPRISTPHSCGNPCSRPRHGCNHACPLSCHPGPCPPCTVLITVGCWCGKEKKSVRCATMQGQTRLGIDAGKTEASGISCNQRCSKLLGCGNHTCDNICHPGDCEPCAVREIAKCYCGKNTQEMPCGEGVNELCGTEGGETWTGRYICEDTCDRPYDCGIHTCQLSCHVHPLTVQTCPRDPSLVTHCPCGKRELMQLNLPDGQVTHRVKCTDNIPTCGLTCGKKLDGCEHICAIPCHLGPCPPCSVPLTLPCRCGSSTRTISCSIISSPQSSTDSVEVLCERPCSALRACGRHQCNRICCPLASLAALSKGKAGKRRIEDAVHLDEEGWHECDLVCNKPLSCGNHRCEKRDHRGLCPPCLRSSFEEMVCPCSRTVIEPPIPCGTRMTCSYPCALPPPPCGHPKTPHACHAFDDMLNADASSDDGDALPATRSCPPCPFLASKQCACGKNVVKNVRCSQEKVSCGVPCGKLLACGFHQCEKLCHGDGCGPCIAPCGKPRKLCLPAHHACTLPCHAPSSCSESEPCQAQITITCPCGRIQQPTTCGRSTSNPTGRENASAGQYQIHCNNECAIAKRNAKLAEAFGISRPEDKGMGISGRTAGSPYSVTWVDDLISFARMNIKFCLLVEKTFADFVTSEKKSQVLPYMPETRRGFVQKVAAVYRMDTQMVDQEPRRSVQIIRRIDTRIPLPLLSSVSGPSSNLGKLADLRSHPQTHTTHSLSTTPSQTLSHAGSASARSWTTIASGSSRPSTPGLNTNPALAQPDKVGQPSDQTRATISRIAHVSSKVQTSLRPPVGASNATASAPDTDSTHVPDDWEQDDA